MIVKLTIDEAAILSALEVDAPDIGSLAALIEAAEWPSAEVVIYALATVHHETMGTFLPICEAGEAEDFAELEPMTPMGAYYGNRWEGDGYLFRRRGYMPICGRHAYTVFGSVLGLSLTTEPDSALDAEVAFRILRTGMLQGLFTGRKITEYISPTLANYVEARRAFHRLDKANVIAGYARAIAESKGVQVAEEHQ